MQEPPLVVDLDGTLLRSDLLVESALVFIRDQPNHLYLLVQWLTRGKAALKQQLALATKLDVTVLPYNQSVIKFIINERNRGRKVVLATASHCRLAEQVAAYLNLFDEVIATTGDHNLTAHNKRDALIETFGERGFDYAGNSDDDLPVWSSALNALVVNAPSSVERKARALGNVIGIIHTPSSTPRDWIKALRVHQWLKNLLVFVPLLAAHKYAEWSLLLHATLAFISFSLCASSAYVLNDLLDLRDDRHHARKKLRPFASGNLSIQSGLAAFPLLLIATFSLSTWRLPLNFTLWLGCYYALTLAYSLWFKRRMVADVIVLAVLYTLRIIAGAVALGIPLSFWLLAFSMFMFLSLALVKRYAELFQIRARSCDDKARGRGYFADDLSMIASLGAASGYTAVMILALYINDAHTAQLYRQPQLIWLACPLLLIWVSMVWMLAHRGAMNEDPVTFAVRDRTSLSIVASIALVFWAAI